jgi:hypothetical protein
MIVICDCWTWLLNMIVIVKKQKTVLLFKLGIKNIVSEFPKAGFKHDLILIYQCCVL